MGLMTKTKVENFLLHMPFGIWPAGCILPVEHAWAWPPLLTFAERVADTAHLDNAPDVQC